MFPSASGGGGERKRGFRRLAGGLSIAVLLELLAGGVLVMYLWRGWPPQTQLEAHPVVPQKFPAHATAVANPGRNSAASGVRPANALAVGGTTPSGTKALLWKSDSREKLEKAFKAPHKHGLSYGAESPSSKQPLMPVG